MTKSISSMTPAERKRAYKKCLKNELSKAHFTTPRGARTVFVKANKKCKKKYLGKVN